jgi:hypothetical protein
VVFGFSWQNLLDPLPCDTGSALLGWQAVNLIGCWLGDEPAENAACDGSVAAARCIRQIDDDLR